MEALATALTACSTADVKKTTLVEVSPTVLTIIMEDFMEIVTATRAAITPLPSNWGYAEIIVRGSFHSSLAITAARAKKSALGEENGQGGFRTRIPIMATVEVRGTVTGKH